MNSELSKKPIPIFLRYVKLSEFCHVCGLVGHARHDCLSAFSEKKLAANLVPRYKFLRAPSPPHKRNNPSDNYKFPPSFKIPPTQPKSPKSSNPSFSRSLIIPPMLLWHPHLLFPPVLVPLEVVVDLLNSSAPPLVPILTP